MRILLSLLLVISSLAVKAQVVKKKNTLSANYAIGYSIYMTDATGAASINGVGHHAGIHYNRHFSMNLSFETGLRYTHHALDVSGTDGNGLPYERKGKSSFIHAPFLVEYNFLSYLFAQLGPTVSVQLDSELDNNQSGIGVWGAFGAKFPMKNYELKVYPYYQSQSLISFSAENSYYSLQNIGLNVGFGYRF